MRYLLIVDNSEREKLIRTPFATLDEANAAFEKAKSEKKNSAAQLWDEENIINLRSFER